MHSPAPWPSRKQKALAAAHSQGRISWFRLNL
jgi:hypothetical protein